MKNDLLFNDKRFFIGIANVIPGCGGTIAITMGI